MVHKPFLSFLFVAICASVATQNLGMQSAIRSLLSSKKGIALTVAGLGCLAYGSYKLYKKWSAASPEVTPQFATFWDWKHACDRLPRFADDQDNPGQTPLSVGELQRGIDRFWKVSAAALGNTQRWLQDNWRGEYYGSLPKEYANPVVLVLDKNVTELSLMPFVHYKKVEAGTEKLGASDIHGDIHSLNAYLEELKQENILDARDPFKIVNPQVLLVFHGDNVDGGWYGAEVLYTLYRLYCENPGQVILVRGNHEDKPQNAKGGFKQELDKKFPGLDQQIIYRTYDLLPAAAYVGVADGHGTVDFSLCTHAYVEIGFDPQPLFQHGTASYAFINRRMGRNRILQGLPIAQSIKDRLINSCYWDEPKELPAWNIGDLCFGWGDLRPLSDEQDSEKVTVSGRIGAAFGQQITEALLHAQSHPNWRVRILERGHQHVKLLPGGDNINPLFTKVCHGEHPGVAVVWPPQHEVIKREPGQLWNGAVVTLWSSPNLPFNMTKLSNGTETEQWPHQSIARLKMNAGFANWRLSTLNIPQMSVAIHNSTVQTATT